MFRSRLYGEADALEPSSLLASRFMQSSLRKVVALVALFVAAYQPACSSDDGDDGGDGNNGGSGGASGSGGSGGGASNCDPACPSGETCQGCFNPDNPDEPLWACIAEGVSC